MTFIGEKGFVAVVLWELLFIDDEDDEDDNDGLDGFMNTPVVNGGVSCEDWLDAENSFGVEKRPLAVIFSFP